MYSLPSYYYYGISEIQHIIRDSGHLTANRDAHADTNTNTLITCWQTRRIRQRLASPDTHTHTHTHTHTEDLHLSQLAAAIWSILAQNVPSLYTHTHTHTETHTHTHTQIPIYFSHTRAREHAHTTHTPMKGRHANTMHTYRLWVNLICPCHYLFMCLVSRMK